jgi:hypothetical protein
VTTARDAGQLAPPRAGIALVPEFVAAAALVAALAWSWRTLFVDDAFIGLRYAANLLAGHGFVLHPGETPVEGVTNLGWTLLLAALGVVGPLDLAAKLAGLVALIATLALLAALIRRLAAIGATAAHGVLLGAPLLLVASSFDIAYFALAGMETGLLAALLIAMALLARRDAEGWRVGLLAGIAAMVRPEAIVVPLVYAALRRDRQGWRVAGVALALVALATLLRLAWFGDWLPQPARAKGSGIAVWLINLRGLATAGSAYLPFPLLGLPALALMALGWQRLRARAAAEGDMLAAIAATGVLFVVYALPDWTSLARYAAPYAPAMIVLAWFALTPWLAGRRIAGLALLASLLGVNGLDHVARHAMAERWPFYVVFGERLVEPARWIALNTPAEAVIASRRIGVLAFHGRRRVFDYAVGIADRDVPKLFAGSERGIDTPNDTRLAALWRSRTPTHLLEDDDVIDRIARAAGGTRERFVVQGAAFRVVRAFDLGRERQWLLAERLGE